MFSFSIQIYLKLSSTQDESSEMLSHHKCMQVTYSARYFCSILNKAEFFRPILSKIANIKFQLKSVKIQPHSSTRTHWRQADRRTSRIFAEKAKNREWNEWIDQGYTWITLIFPRYFGCLVYQSWSAFILAFAHNVCVCVCVCV
jgi:hypothetical protein